MKAQDLRIGNFVLDDSNCFSKVIGFKPFDDSIRCDEKEGCELLVDFYDEHQSKWFYGYTTDINKCHGIKLTEEWLRKFGFEVKHNGHHLNGILIKYNFKGGFVIDISQCMGFVGLKYVHELQNLYHALTREELTLKE